MSKVTPIVERITGERSWRYTGSNGRFALSAPLHAYTLNYSCDGKVWTACEDATPIGETTIVINAPTGIFFKCVGLPSDESIVLTY